MLLPPEPRSLRGLLQPVETLKLLAQAIASEDRITVRKMWSSFADSLLVQMDVQESRLIPLLRNERQARVLIQEHQHLRERLTILNAAIDADGLRFDALRDFLDVLNAHFRSEMRLVEAVA